jgi:GTP-binding protein HflX
MRALTGEEVYIANQLFATLDTRTRRWTIPHWGDVLLSDTVGFIKNLPHHLVASFRSTLEEARHADLLLHVVDASHPDAEQQIRTVNEVLKDLGIDAAEPLLVLNKLDAVEDRSLVDVLRGRHANSVTVSAATGAGLDRLAQEVANRLGEGHVDAVMETSVGNGRLFAYLSEHAEVTNKEYHDSRVTMDVRIPRRFLHSVLADPDVDVRGTDGAPIVPADREDDEEFVGSPRP